jgi:hypothetical protein
MLLGFEGDQWIVQSVSLPVSLGRAPIARVSGKPKQELVMAPVLVRLVGVIWRAAVGGRRYPRGAHQGQAQRIVVRLIGAILAIGKDSGAKASALIG